MLFCVSVPNLNKRTICEALVNAFTHRDYLKMRRVRATIRDEGFTIANPCSFVKGVFVKNSLKAEPHRKNFQLAYALKRIGLAEKQNLFGRPLLLNTAKQIL